MVVAPWPTAGETDPGSDDLTKAEDIVSNLRNLRKERNIVNKVLLELKVKENELFNRDIDSVIAKLGTFHPSHT